VEHDLLRQAQALLAHQVRSGDLSEVLQRALRELVARLEKRKFAATARPRAPRRPSTHPRHVPAHVRRAVWERDGGRCSFVGESGHRCEAREHLEFDHILEVARGGVATVDGMRLLCRAHNQFAAERTFGSGFMNAKRLAAREARAASERARAVAKEAAERAAVSRDAAARAAADRRRTDEVIPWLRSLRIGADDAQRAAESIGPMPGESLEARVRAALAFHGAARHPRAKRAVSEPPLQRSA